MDENALKKYMYIHVGLSCCQNTGDRNGAHIRNEFDFWKVHEIINTSGLLQK